MFETFHNVSTNLKTYFFPELVSERTIISDDLLEVLYEDDGSHYQTKRINGTVTKVHESRDLAIIDHEIYMDLAMAPVIGGKTIRLGDRCILNVRRRSDKDAWTVERVDMVERGAILEHTTLEYLKTKVLVGKVTNIAGNVSVNDGEVILESKEANGILLAVGDWLSINVMYDPEEVDDKPKSTGVTPLRQWKLEGRITVLDGNVGIIDDNIYLHTSVCING